MTASGTLGTTPFTNALITMTLVGDTSNIFAGNLIGGSAYVGTLGEFRQWDGDRPDRGRQRSRTRRSFFPLLPTLASSVDPVLSLGTLTNGTGIVAATGPAWFGYNSGQTRKAGNRSRRFREWWGITPSFLQCFPHVAWCPFIPSARASPHGKLDLYGCEHSDLHPARWHDFCSRVAGRRPDRRNHRPDLRRAGRLLLV